MSDVFLAFAIDDDARAAVLQRFMESRGWSVFRDHQLIPAAPFPDITGRELRAAACVIVLWTRTSVTTPFVIDAAEAGQRRRELVSVLLEDVAPPLRFRHDLVVDLSSWTGAFDDDRLDHLAALIGRVVGGHLPPGSLAPPTSPRRGSSLVRRIWRALGTSFRPAPNPLDTFERTSLLARELVTVPSHPTGSDDDGDWVRCTAFGPRRMAAGTQALLQVFAHLPADAGTVDDTAKALDDKAVRLGYKSLGVRVPFGVELTYSLRLPGFQIQSPVQSLTWQRHPESVTFAVNAPREFLPADVVGTVTVRVNTIPVGELSFKISVTRLRRRQRRDVLSHHARPYRRAFISYASPDRDRVLARVQMLRLAGIDYFQDLLDLEPGERWTQALYRHIDDCDLFLLFWSRNAKASTWVLKEVRYALERQGGDHDAPPAIHPVIIEGPPVAPPPPELAHLYFGDRLTYFLGRPNA